MAEASRTYRLTYESSPGRVTVWEKTAAELLVPNGTDTLLDWMLKEVDAHGGKVFTLELLFTNEINDVMNERDPALRRRGGRNHVDMD